MADDLTWTARRHDGRTDVVVGQLPAMPARFAAVEAARKAAGVELVDGEDGEQTLAAVREADHADFAAAILACLGLCWSSPALPHRSLRDCGRDVIEYGEWFQTSLMEAGYVVNQDLFDAGMECHRAIQTSIAEAMGLVREEEASFGGAQEAS